MLWGTGAAAKSDGVEKRRLGVALWDPGQGRCAGVVLVDAADVRVLADLFQGDDLAAVNS
jgi:hypothetical protein